MILAFSLAGPAFGQTPAAPSSPGNDVNAQVTAHYEQGKAAAKANEWQKAYDAFLSAWRLKPHYQIAANLARAELMLGKHRDAAEHLAYFLRHAKDISPGDRQQAQSMFDQARAKVAQVTIQVDVPEAEVLVDGKPAGRTPLEDPIFVDPGKRVIEARRDGYTPAKQELDAAPGSSHTPLLHLVPLPAKAPNAPPGSPEQPPQGVEGTQPRRSWIPVYVGGGVSVALLATGIGLTVAANAKDTEADKLWTEMEGIVCPGGDVKRCRELKDLRGQKDTFHNAAVGTYIGAGIGAVATAAYFFFWPAPAKSSSSAATRVVVVPTSGGIQVTGNF